MTEKTNISQKIRELAFNVGFDDIGFYPAKELTDEKKHLQTWLADGFHADMKYMEKNLEKRVNPALLVEGSVSVITVIKNYFPNSSNLSLQAPKIARFAYNQDYHVVMKEKMQQLFSLIKTEIYPNLKGRCFVDSAPLLEKALAVKAGMGWIGKNSLLINKKWGSWIFTGELVVNIELAYNSVEIENGCGTCTLCIESCPTNAIKQNKTIDANRCISYHTIENKGFIPDSVKNKMQGWAYGCDICQEVCPWNRKVDMKK